MTDEKPTLRLALLRIDELESRLAFNEKGHRAAQAQYEAAQDEIARLQKPINMILLCPNCGEQHIDEVEADDDDYQASVNAGRQSPRWLNPPHRSHECGCGYIWRPADVYTNGVKSIKTRGENDLD